MDLRLMQLRWLANQPYPMWGGHLERGEPIGDPDMWAWVADGIIEVVEEPRPGYVITQKGKEWINQRSGDRRSRSKEDEVA